MISRNRNTLGMEVLWVLSTQISRFFRNPSIISPVIVCSSATSRSGSTILAQSGWMTKYGANRRLCNIESLDKIKKRTQIGDWCSLGFITCNIKVLSNLFDNFVCDSELLSWSVKYLGFSLGFNLSMESRCDFVAVNISRGLGVIRKLKSQVPLNVLPFACTKCFIMFYQMFYFIILLLALIYHIVARCGLVFLFQVLERSIFYRIL